MNQNAKKSLYSITECAIFIALAVVLSFFPEIPIGGNGGSISFNMIPLLILCYRHGIKYSFISCFVFSILYVFIGGKWGYGLPSVLLDYVLAYTSLGIAGIAGGASKLKPKLFFVFATIAGIVRYGFSVLSGVVLYGITAPEEIMGLTTANPILFSVLYNSYIFLNVIIAIVATIILFPALKRLEKLY